MVRLGDDYFGVSGCEKKHNQARIPGNLVVSSGGFESDLFVWAAGPNNLRKHIMKHPQKS